MSDLIKDEEGTELKAKIRETVGAMIDLFEDAGLGDQFIPICAAAIATAAKGPITERGKKEDYFAGCLTNTEEGELALIYVDYDVMPFMDFCISQEILELPPGQFVMLEKGPEINKPLDSTLEA